MSSIADNKVSEICVNVLHTFDRDLDAKRVRELLAREGARISLIQVPDDPLTSRHRGTIYYFFAGNNGQSAARRLAKIVRHVEVVLPQFYDLHAPLGVTHSIWLAGKTPPHAPKDESHATPEASNSCPICAHIDPKKLYDHLLDKHPEEAFAEAARTLRLEKVTYKSFRELQRKRFADLRWLISACLRGWQDNLNESDRKLATSDPAILREYARILESRVSGGRSTIRRGVVTSVFEEIARFEDKIPIKKLDWKLLPSGKTPFPKILEHLNQLAKKSGKAIYDTERLNRIHSLGPTETYIGDAKFHG